MVRIVTKFQVTLATWQAAIPGVTTGIVVTMVTVLTTAAFYAFTADHLRVPPCPGVPENFQLPAGRPFELRSQ